jgi:alkylated DNA repair dioxygenase AlkB
MPEQINLFEDFQSTDGADLDLGIKGLTYRAGFLTPQEQETALAEVDRQSWQNDLKRRVQHYGYRYDYKARRVDHSMRLGELPAFALVIAQKLVDFGLMTQMPDQLIVNEYEPGQGITAHIDCEPCFGPCIATVSLGWVYEMQFIHAETREVRAIMLAKGSALAMTDEARYQWLHQIKARRFDHRIRRQRRLSLTFRNVILSV